jgi:hypothetical protein
MMKPSWFPSKITSATWVVWQHLDGKKTLNNIKDLMTGEFEVSDPDAEEDITEFVGELEKIDAILPTAHQKE